MVVLVDESWAGNIQYGEWAFHDISNKPRPLHMHPLHWAASFNSLPTRIDAVHTPKTNNELLSNFRLCHPRAGILVNVK
jgi:hypothetical protein